MKDMYIHIIEVTPIINNVLKDSKISCDGYTDINNAIKFIESRADEPRRIDSEFVWISKLNKYKILFVKVADIIKGKTI